MSTVQPTPNKCKSPFPRPSESQVADFGDRRTNAPLESRPLTLEFSPELVKHMEAGCEVQLVVRLRGGGGVSGRPALPAHPANDQKGSEPPQSPEGGAVKSPRLRTRASKAKVAQAAHKDECPICMEAMDDAGTMTRTLCGHYFHTECHRSWLESRSEAGQLHTCPLCNKILGP